MTRTLTIALVALASVACSELPPSLYFDAALRGDAGTADADGNVTPGTDGPRPDGTPPVTDGPPPLPDGPLPPGTFDWRDGVMYFVLLDRFYDGNSSNNKPEPNVETAANWQGGDLAGLLSRIKSGYFTDLGVNVLWLSSPVDAPDGKYPGTDGHDYTGYHGYWPADLTKVEERLGDVALLKQVVDEAAVIVDSCRVHRARPVGEDPRP